MADFYSSLPGGLGEQWSNAYAQQKQAFAQLLLRQQYNAALSARPRMTAPEIENCPPPGVDEALAKSALDDYYNTTIKAVVWLRDADVSRAHFSHQWLASASGATVTSIGIDIGIDIDVFGRDAPRAFQSVTPLGEPFVRANEGYRPPGGLVVPNIISLDGTERAIRAVLTLLGPCRVWAIRFDHEVSTAYVLPRPMFLETVNGIPHRTDGPAVVWPRPDATQEYYLDGIRVPPEAINEPAKVPEIALSHPNAEVRRVLMAHYGHEKLLLEHGVIIQTDDCGKLWGIGQGIGSDLRMVEVENSTPEPDGTRRKYMLRVPPDTRTAKAGVAWTFWLRPGEYQPEKQT